MINTPEENMTYVNDNMLGQINDRIQLNLTYGYDYFGNPITVSTILHHRELFEKKGYKIEYHKASDSVYLIWDKDKYLAMLTRQEERDKELFGGLDDK